MLSQFGRKQFALTAFCGLLMICGALGAQPSPARALQVPDASTPSPAGFPASNPPMFPPMKGMSQKQQNALVKDNFKKAKKDSEKLSTLADSLRKEIQSSNPNVMSLDIVNKANQIEKLAKKIKEEAEM